MKPVELYKRTPESISYDINILKGCYYNHIPELEFLYICEDSLKKNNRVSIRIYKDFNFDGRRFWRLASVYFDNKPCMIIQNAGREGDDHSDRFITDKNLYMEMINFIGTLISPNIGEIEISFNEDDDIKGLDEFYGNKLGGEFKRSYY